ncbi:MAG: helicase [Desulfamplus sp.]|nr:helicase [Desulfamplus sp.]
MDRCFTGFLFPIIESENGLDSIEDDDDEYDDNDNSKSSETEVTKVKKERKYIPPSSAGFSFFITGENIVLRTYYSAVHYKSTEDRDSKRQKFKSLDWEKEKFNVDGQEIEFTPEGQKQQIIFDGKAKIDALWRSYKNGYIVTLTVSNNQKISNSVDVKKFRKEQNEKTLFEVELICIIESGTIDVYPSKNRALLTDEEKEIELRYKDLHIYAVGHGVAANWTLNKENKMEIWTDFIPTVEVPQLTANTGQKNDIVLTFSFLKDCEKKDYEKIIEQLTLFIKQYELWIVKQKEQTKKEEDKEDKETATKIVESQIYAEKRMRKGIDCLKNNENARIAFAVMNRAMLMQWISNDSNNNILKEHSQYKWRPFQLAFILMVLESVINEDSQYRDILDLIWFPTGGGKTEAYLGLMGFLFVYRRLEYPASYGGTVTIMRYTLRLLTSQQFLRANKVILALELIRQENENRYGKEAFSTGLWVGGASSPNTFHQARKSFEEGHFSKLVINRCPWCDAEFTKKNYIVRDDAFHFTCTNIKCDFGKQNANVLPCNVVDEALYKNPPTLLIATVDKFARLAWEERGLAFFGANGKRPPELIIQDELHLISNALGSIVGLYEVAIDTVLICRGIRTKYIASTATIKNAEKQIQALFGRDTAIFPPSGIRYDDSYFAKTVPLEEKPGRLYVGYLAPLLSKQSCLEPLAGILLSAPIKLFKDMEHYIDKWWTQIVYHGSLKSVGNSRTLYQSGINSLLNKITIENLKNEIEEDFPGFTEVDELETVEDFYKIEDLEVKGLVNKYLPVRDLKVKTLTSNQSAEENSQIFKALAKEKDDHESVDVALATNMISVGLDVSRLALMIINGQPLTTAEYIQASSRVGRGETPGIVFVNYYKTQARSLSHYENFRSYHDSFYRFVEPSSLTPFTFQARSRALHAALIIALRYSNVDLLKNDSAGNFDPERDSIKKVIKEIKLRCAIAIGKKKETVDQINRHVDDLVESWQREVEYSHANKIKLVFYSKDGSFNSLMCNFDEEKNSWKTLQSMRNVENSALIKLLRGVKLDNEI